MTDEWQDCTNGELETDQQSTGTERRKVECNTEMPTLQYDMLEETESLSTSDYTSELTRNETAEMNEVDRPSRKPDHDRVKTKKCYQCRDDKHLIRDCIVGLKTWAKHSRMQPCHICRKSGHKEMQFWFRDQKPGEKRCFHCGSIEYRVKNCTLPRQTNASLEMEENHGIVLNQAVECMTNMIGAEHRTLEERIRILVMNIIGLHERLRATSWCVFPGRTFMMNC